MSLGKKISIHIYNLAFYKTCPNHLPNHGLILTEHVLRAHICKYTGYYFVKIVENQHLPCQ